MRQRPSNTKIIPPACVPIYRLRFRYVQRVLIAFVYLGESFDKACNVGDIPPELRPDRWTVRTVLERIASVGDPFAQLVEPQVLPSL